jgi:hypothetical protein
MDGNIDLPTLLLSTTQQYSVLNSEDDSRGIILMV